VVVGREYVVSALSRGLVWVDTRFDKLRQL
jgi:hypothetical protein